jgi:nicotinamidase-related amidase
MTTAHLETAAVLLMDMQEGTCRPWGPVGAGGLAEQVEHRDVLGKTGAALSTLRRRLMTVIHVRLAFDAEYALMTSASPRFASFAKRGIMCDGSTESRICAEVAPIPGEPVITKGCVNPFVGTALTEVLRRRSAGHLILAGVATNHVVEGTARYAADAGFRVTVLEDLCAGVSEEMHLFSVEKILPSYAAVTTSDVFIREIARPGGTGSPR